MNFVKHWEDPFYTLFVLLVILSDKLDNIISQNNIMSNFFILNWKIKSNFKYDAYGGHLTSAIISGTGEIVIEEIKNTVKREFNKEAGLNLLFN